MADNMMRYSLGLMLGLTILLGPTIKATAEEFPKPSAELCSIYRQGPVVHRRMPVYYGAPSADPKSFYWIDIWFRPEYLFDPSTTDLPRPDGFPNRDLLFDVNIADGQPLPLADRRSARPQDRSFFTLLLMGGLEGLSIDRYLSIFADWHIYEGDRFRNGELPAVIWSGDYISGMERFDIPDLRPYSLPLSGYAPPVDDFFAERGDEHILAVMRCTQVGSRPVPGCEIKEKSEFFELSIGGFRRDQLDELERIRQLANNFATCLTWKEE